MVENYVREVRSALSPVCGMMSMSITFIRNWDWFLGFPPRTVQIFV